MVSTLLTLRAGKYLYKHHFYLCFQNTLCLLTGCRDWFYSEMKADSTNIPWNLDTPSMRICSILFGYHAL